MRGGRSLAFAMIGTMRLNSVQVPHISHFDCFRFVLPPNDRRSSILLLVERVAGSIRGTVSSNVGLNLSLRGPGGGRGRGAFRERSARDRDPRREDRAEAGSGAGAVADGVHRHSAGRGAVGKVGLQRDDHGGLGSWPGVCV